MSHELQALFTMRGASSHALEMIRDYVQSLSLRREIATSIRHADSSISDTVVRRVARYTASEIIALRRDDAQERVDFLKQDHMDSVATSRPRAAFEGDKGVTDLLIEDEWTAINNLARMYAGTPIELSHDGATLPLLRRASLIEMNNPGM